jgi:hypothetical protein
MKKNVVEQSTPVDTFHSNTDETEFTINTYQDVEPILEENKRHLNEYGSLLNSGKTGEGVRVASIPLNVWQQWMQETNGAIEKDHNLMKKYLNDPDNKYFRTTPTRV